MMVLSYDDSRLLVVLQIDHSRVAGLLAAHWGNNVFAEPSPYSSVVVAAQEHDNGWWDWEIKPAPNDEGYPMDYITGGGLSRAIHTAFDRNGIARVAQQDLYAGLLVGMHQAGLNCGGYGLLPYMKDRRHIPEVGEFMRYFEEEVRPTLLKELGQSQEYAQFSTEEYIWTNYKLMEVFDQLAQFICNRYPFNSTERQGGPPNVTRNVPVGPGKEDTTITVTVLDEKRALVRPFPFDVSPLEISFPGRLMPNRHYPDRADFLRHFYKAERLTMTYILEEP